MSLQEFFRRGGRRLRAWVAPTAFDRAIRAFLEHDGDHTVRLDYPLAPSSLVFDVGGYEGQFASDIFAKHLCKVWVFEPMPNFVEHIRSRFSANDSITVFPFGLGGKSRSEWFGAAADGTSSVRTSAGKEKVRAEIRSLAEFLTERRVDQVDLLKVNIEGGEYELLDAMDADGVLNRFRFIQVQFHRVASVDTKAVERYYAILSKTHELDWAYRPFVWESWRRRGS